MRLAAAAESEKLRTLTSYAYDYDRLAPRADRGRGETLIKIEDVGELGTSVDGKDVTAAVAAAAVAESSTFVTMSASDAPSASVATASLAAVSFEAASIVTASVVEAAAAVPAGASARRVQPSTRRRADACRSGILCWRWPSASLRRRA